jgi:hypothetical protein
MMHTQRNLQIVKFHGLLCLSIKLLLILLEHLKIIWRGTKITSIWRGTKITSTGSTLSSRFGHAILALCVH